MLLADIKVHSLKGYAETFPNHPRFPPLVLHSTYTDTETQAPPHTERTDCILVPEELALLDCSGLMSQYLKCELKASSRNRVREKGEKGVAGQNWQSNPDGETGLDFGESQVQLDQLGRAAEGDSKRGSANTL